MSKRSISPAGDDAAEAPGLIHLLDEVAHHLGPEANKPPSAVEAPPARPTPLLADLGGSRGRPLPDWPNGFAAHEQAIDEPARLPDLAGQALPSAEPASMQPPVAPSGSQEATRPSVAPKNYRAGAGGAALLALAGIAGAVWFWSGGFGAKPTPVAVAIIAPDAMSRGKQRSSARITPRRCGGIAKPPTREMLARKPTSGISTTMA